ncbi:MAG: bifunctional phosphopantothenoylcysteine decarboxylase/phosphopantothenate--cysteine ligase CoaBC [Nitrospirae bacterium]|nr:bifunctional phosphopantothenoylcysteine decarboxylase/phosphopantothenate--cysteine ligase CoaBC [Nitrospirota bacterium]
MLTGRHVVLGVTGSIAAYKAVGLLRRLTERGAQVTVVMTAAAKRFVTPLTFQALSRRPVYDDLFDPRDEILHLSLAQAADLFLIAPATANTLARLAAGSANDLLSSLALSARCPVLLAPAMDAVMWEHPLVQRNLDALRGIGVGIIPPESGPLASGLVGPGRLAAEDVILAAVEARLESSGPWVGAHVVVTAGPTREAIDAVRTITNRSSGKMGYALADAARVRGAMVTLITGPTDLPVPVGVDVVAVETAEEMRRAVLDRIDKTTILLMAAAVADYRPKVSSPGKLKKSGSAIAIELVPTPDILGEVAALRTETFVVGFAAETDRLVERAIEKLHRKQLDLIVANDVSRPGIGFGADDNEVTMIDRTGAVMPLPRLPKRVLADRILDHIHAIRLQERPSPPPST